MPSSPIRKTNQFLATDASGTQFVIVEFTHMVDVTTIHDTERKLEPGMKAYRLPNGDPVNRVGDSNEFEIVRTGARVRAPSS